MEKSMLIALTGDKGGVGKSTLAILVAEWLLAHGTRVKLVDADPNQTTQTWLDKCTELGYRVSTDDAPVTIVDTAGTSGSSLQRYIRQADFILVPFQPHVADLETVTGWFLSINDKLQDRVAFIPNRLAHTIEQRDGLSELEELLKEEGRGRMVPGLSNRPAVYPPLLNGRTTNFFETKVDPNTKAETRELFTALFPETQDKEE